MFHVEHVCRRHGVRISVGSMFHVEHLPPRCSTWNVGMFHVEHSLTGGYVNDTIGVSSPVA